MGVRTCSKNGCTNIRCRTYVDWVGYICEECQESFMTSKLSVVSSEKELIKNLNKWMKKEKKVNVGNGIDIRKFFDNCKTNW